MIAQAPPRKEAEARPAVQLRYGPAPIAVARWLAFVSGAAALGGQVGWSRLAASAVGATFAATALTLSGAMLGWAAGSVLSGSTVRRFGARPALAATIIACSLALALVPTLLLLAGQVHGYPGVRMLLTAALLVAGHLPFGAVLPAVAAWRGPSTDRAADGELCALSAAGAVAGAIGVGGFLAAHLACDVIGWLSAGILLVSALSVRPSAGAVAQTPSTRRALPTSAVAAAFGLGFLGLATEFAWVRLLGFYWEASPSCFAWVTASYVGGLALGSWAASRLAPPRPRALTLVLALSSALLGISAAAASCALAADTPAERLGLAALLVGLPATFFGASFVLLLRRHSGAGAPGRALGLLSAANAAGSAAGPLALFAASGVLPWPARVLFLLACGYAILALGMTRRKRMTVPLAAALALGGWTLTPAGPAARDYSPHESVAAGDFDATVLPYVRSGLEGTVAVTRATGAGVDMLWIDRGLQGDSSILGRRLPARLGRLPTQILGRPPRRALAIGLGTGLTLSGMAEGGARQIDVAELVEGVIDANRTLLAESNGRVLDRSGIRVTCADGRTILADAPEPYDLIVADMIFPSVAGSGTLFSREFYALARRRLSADGIFAHWVPCLQLAPADLSAIVAGFLESFPDGTAWIGSFTPRRFVLGLVGGAIPAGLPESTATWMALGPGDLHRLATGSRAIRDADAGLEYRSSRPPQERLFGEANLRTVMKLMPDGPWRLFAEGALAEHAGDFALARERYEAAVAQGAGETDAEFQLEQLRFEKHFHDAQEAMHRREEEAVLAHLRAAASHPVLARGNLFLGDVFAALGRPVEAAREFERAASKASRSADARMKLALLAWGLGDADRARTAFESACALRPDRPDLYRRFGREISPGRP